MEKKRGIFYRGIMRSWRFAEKRLPEKLRGESEVLERKLSVKYEGEKLSAAVQSYQRKNLLFYAAILSGVIAVSAIVFLTSSMSETEIIQIGRPEHGAGQKTIPVIVEAVRGETTIEGTANIIIQEEALDDEQKNKILNDFAQKLPDLVAPKFGDVRIVTEDFYLPTEDDESGISILWESSDPVLISKEGYYDVLALAGEEESVRLTASLNYEGCEKEVAFDVVLRDDPSLYQASVSRKIQILIDEISMGRQDGNVVLPDHIGDDIKLKWMKYSADGIIWVLFCGAISVAVIFFRRYFFAEQEIRRYRQGIVRNFPPFIDKLVLLLNSGLTVLTAMEKMAEDCSAAIEYDKKNTLAYEAAEIGKRVKETNASVIKEWREFASRTGINEIMRFSAVMEDNIGKGTSLAEKLEVESCLLRDRERTLMQEKIRLIDTKLTLPMILMLVSLVLVTVAPAMMQM